MHDALVHFDLVLRDQTDGDVGIQKCRIARPAFQDHQRISIFRRHAGHVAGRNNSFREINHQPDFPAIGNPQTQIIVEQIQHCVGTARHASLPIIGPVKAVISFEGATEVGLAVRRTKTQSAAVVVQYQIALAEERIEEKILNGNKVSTLRSAELYQVAHIARKKKQSI